MTKLNKDVTSLVGNTPIVELSRYSKAKDLQKSIYAKVEFFNPGGSVKDRVALSMIEDAESKGLLSKECTIIEPTSGNTGVGLAMICAVKGYRLILTMPDSMSIERRKLLKAYGAEIVLTEGALSMSGAVEKAQSLQREIKGSVILSQFDNSANPQAHYRTTAEEIWSDLDGNIDIFVAGVGTGGTVSGVGRRLKELNPDIKVVAIEPLSSPVLSGGKPSKHMIQGIGANFIPKNYDSSVVDKIIQVSDEDAFSSARTVAKTEGLLVGISSGAAVSGATYLSQLEEFQGKQIVTLLPDTGERYLSTSLFSE